VGVPASVLLKLNQTKEVHSKRGPVLVPRVEVGVRRTDVAVKYCALDDYVSETAPWRSSLARPPQSVIWGTKSPQFPAVYSSTSAKLSWFDKYLSYIYIKQLPFCRFLICLT